jgi:hypothetical protein
VQSLPQREPLRFSQLQDVLVHTVKGDVLSSQAVVAPLKRDEVIPHGGRDQQLVPQLPILLVSAVQTVFVQLANGDRIAHAFGAPTPEAVVGVDASTTNPYSTRSSRKKQTNVRVRTPFGIITRLQSRGFPAPESYKTPTLHATWDMLVK